jgi:hypothetical protein
VASVRQPNLAKSLICIKISAAVSAEEAATMLYKLGKAFSMEGLIDIEPQRISNAASKLVRLLHGDGSSSVQRIEQLGGKQVAQSAWALSQLEAYCEPNEAKRFGLSLAAGMLRIAAIEDWRSLSGVLYGLAKTGISCGSSKEVQQ